MHTMMKILNLRKSEEHEPGYLTNQASPTTSHITTQTVEKLSNSSISLSTISTLPPLDVNRLGVPQPTLATKDILIIIFMLLLWAYSLYLTYKAWYKLLYSDSGEERSNMWRYELY